MGVCLEIDVADGRPDRLGAEERHRQPIHKVRDSRGGADDQRPWPGGGHPAQPGSLSGAERSFSDQVREEVLRGLQRPLIARLQVR
jgi:hypothetical protein